MGVMEHQPAEEAVRGQLERILASDGFVSSDRLCRFLRFSVEAKLRGEADQLKEFLLGREVFDRNDEYDPRLDPIVRVEARRLRTKLQEYYDGAGREDAIRIEIPKGRYAPEFHVTGNGGMGTDSAAARAVPDGEPVPAPASSPRIRPWSAGVAALIAVAAAVAGYFAFRPPPLPQLVVLPASWVWNESDTTADEPLAEVIAAELANQRVADVFAWPAIARFKGQHKTTAEIAQLTNCPKALLVALRKDGGQSRVTVYLLDAERERKAWVGDYPNQPAETPEQWNAIAQRVARELKIH